jgi:2-oxoglutarate dehydrogenase E1 component
MARQEANEVFAQTSFLYGGNAAYLEQLYAEYKENPSSFGSEWHDFFEQLGDESQTVADNAKGAGWKKPHWPLAENGELVSALDGQWPSEAPGSSASGKDGKSADKGPDRASPQPASAPAKLTQDQLSQAARDSVHAIMMIRAYRMRGHLDANLDPLGIKDTGEHPELKPENFGFGPQDMDRKIFIDGVLGLEFATPREMLEILRRTYCGTMGVEFMHISSPEEKSWLQQRIEGPDKEIHFTPEGQKAILNKLIEAEGFEKFLDVKYTGTKRFGLDGGESLIPALEQIIKRGGQLGVKEIVLGMAHRGRLNVLTQVMGKSHRALFHEFKGGAFYPDDVEGSGDVKYHLGASSDREFDGNKVHLSLTANPSHLEIVNPVVLGKARAKQDQFAKPAPDEIVELEERSQVLPLLLHGDAAFAGQGVVAECFGLSALRGHRTAGSVHFIINNQIGFTTDPKFSRSSPYPSDVAKMIEAPIFHVNGDDPEAVVFAAKVAIEFRQKFHKPVVIDMICYRRFGHNEGDEPAFTQPLMYKEIRQHDSITQIYSDKLVKAGHLTADDVEAMRAEWRRTLDEEFEVGQNYVPNKADWLDGQWSGLTTAANSEDEARRGATAVDKDRLVELGKALTRIPDNFNVHKTIKRFMKNREKMIDTGQGIDWATAEALAFGSLCAEGHPVRLSGQDCERGTFSQRHSVLYDQENEERYIPLNNLTQDQARYEVINSMLSEEAVLGYEYGYSLAEPRALTLWEAQFGDFANGAQVLFDQFISSGERKWFRMSGLVCLLPHGYEGQGPEHSSARLERFLQSCAEDNMQVANCTTPANYFHILRRQLKRDFRKPLILMTPKSLLRHKKAVSTLDELAGESSFHRVLWDDAQMEQNTEIRLVEDSKIRRVVLCSGKVYYDLLEEREKRGINDVYLLRVEQLYPFPAKAVIHELARFKHAEMVWCQEEPKNMGAWSFIEPYLEWTLNHLDAQYTRARYAGRAASAATATGLMSRHLAQLQSLMDDALS